MLLITPRHRREDLTLWRELEHADRLRPIDHLVEASLAAIGAFAQAGPCYCSVSWGKDSVVVADLVSQVDDRIPLIHLRPTNHNPDCDLVRDAYLAGHPRQAAAYREYPVDYTGVAWLTLAEWQRDKATDKQWYAAIRQVEKDFGPRRILGIRAEESRGRRIRCFRWGINSKNACAPLAFWRVADVFAYLAQRSLPVHPAYGYLGGGCWKRERIRVAEIGDTHGRQSGRGEWEQEYYGDWLHKIEHEAYRRRIGEAVIGTKRARRGCS